MIDGRTAPRLIVCLAVVASVACDPDVDEFAADCDQALSGRDVGGTWTLEGDGERSGCSSIRLNGDLTVDIVDPFAIVSTAQDTVFDAGETSTDPDALSEADAFVERILRADHTLTYPAKPDEIEFVGTTTGSCVDFTITEDLGDDESQTIEFVGSVRDDGTLKGYFEGYGPGSCTMSGKITVDVR